MNCPTCGHESREGAKFCVSCGRGFALSCARCGSELAGGARFCGECGTPVRQAAQTPAVDRAPRDYTPKHLAEEILTSRSALEGERKQVTVLFADVKGSLDLAEQVGPEEWHHILNRFFEILSDGVHRFEGTVNQYTGDGIMALFGAPIAHEDHAQRACYAALHLSTELRRYAEDLKRTKGLNFAVRMGINSGEVVVGKIGDDLRMDYTAQGHTVGVAARLEQLAGAGETYLSENTAALVSGFLRLGDLGELDLKGVGAPFRAFELKGIGEVRTRLDAARARGLSRFVGRVHEMKTLEMALEQAEVGQGQVVGVVGEAGVGKSRLSFEFVERCRARGLEIYEAHCPAHGKTVPLLPALELMRGYFGITEQDPDTEARKKIADRLLLLDEAFRETLPLLFEFLGVPDPERPVPRMDPEARQRQLFAFVRRLIQAPTEGGPGLILVDDLHWIDAGSDAFLAQLVEAVSGTRTLLLVNFRPEYHAAWMQKSHYQQVPLLPLGTAQIQELLLELLGKDPSLRGLVERMKERTGGNPFFIEEVVQSLAEAGALEGHKGDYRLVRPVGEIAIPATVQAVVGARIDRLAEREKHLLQTASVIGKEFAEPVLKQVADLPDVDLAASLHALTGAEFIYEASLYPELEYAFRHPLTQEVAYHSQLGDRRSRVHGAVAQAIAELYPEKQEERAALIAHHWEGAGEPLEAARWHARAGEWTGLRDPGEALRHWRQVRSLLQEVAESPETIGLGLMARIQILKFAFRMGMSEAESAKVFTEGRALAERSGNPHALVLLTGLYAGVRDLAGEHEEALRLYKEALQRVEQTGDVGLELAVELGNVFTLRLAGRLREALAQVDRVIERAAGDPKLGAELGGFSPYVVAFHFRTLILADLGRSTEALRALDRAIQLAQEHGEKEVLSWMHTSYAYLARLTGDRRGVLGHGRQAFQIAEKIGSSVSRVLARWALGVVLMQAEEWDEARTMLEESVAIARKTRAGLYIEVSMLALLARTYLALGEEDLARRTADEAVAVLPRRSRLYAWDAHLARARVLLCIEGAKSRDAIEAALAEAMTALQETGAKGWEPFIHEERAALARLLGDEVSRERELRKAHRLFTEIGATAHADRVARELEG